jgi:hypothetical protein
MLYARVCVRDGCEFMILPNSEPIQPSSLSFSRYLTLAYTPSLKKICAFAREYTATTRFVADTNSDGH